MIRIADMHCHIVPGVDDGARTLKDSLDIVEEEYRQGVRLIIVTPHWRRGMFETDRREVEEHFRLLKAAAKEPFPNLEFYLGCEFHVHMDMIEEMRSSPLFRMNGTNMVLTEFSSENDKNYIREALNKEISSGFEPIVAHIERYPDAFHDLNFIEEIKSMGVRIQVNADSVIGEEGRSIRKRIRKMMEEDLVDFIGSDAHNITDRACHLKRCADEIEKYFGISVVKRLMWENPLNIVRRQGFAQREDPRSFLKPQQSEKTRVHHKPVVINYTDLEQLENEKSEERNG